MPIRAPLIKGKVIEPYEKVESLRHEFGGVRPEGRDFRFPIKPEVRDFSSYWFCFVSSLDRAKDIRLVKELLFWGQIYHDDDAEVHILISGFEKEKYDYYRQVFEIVDVPSLVLADNPKPPNDFVKFSPNFFTEELLGKDFEKIRDTMDSLHNHLSLVGNLRKVKNSILKKKLKSVLDKAWKDLKSMISISF